MARILIYTSPARGHLYPAVGIGLELLRRGHQVELHGLSAELGALAETGLDARPLDREIEALPLDDGRARFALTALRSVMRTFLARSLHEVRSLNDCLAARPPDCVLVDVNCLGAAAVVEHQRLPWATFSPYCLPIRSRDVPPFGLGLAPRSDWWGRLRDGLVDAATRAAFASFTEQINRMRRALSLAPIAHAADFALSSPRVLALTSAEFEYPRGDWPASVRLVGPTCWAPPEHTPEWLEDGADYVLVTASTEAQRDARLIEVALRACASLPVSVVATSAAHDPSRFDAPANARVVRFLSHDAILSRAKAVICHGGMGITQRALGHGVPVCVVPAGRDQFEVARRVEQAQAGVFLTPNRLSTQALQRALSQTFASSSGARRLAPALCPRRGAERAANEVLALLGSAA